MILNEEMRFIFAHEFKNMNPNLNTLLESTRAFHALPFVGIARAS